MHPAPLLLQSAANRSKRRSTLYTAARACALHAAFASAALAQGAASSTPVSTPSSVSAASSEAPQPAAPPRLSAEEARRDLRVLKRAFTDLHPGLYRYATAAEIDQAFAEADAAVAGGASRGQMVLIASRLAATMRCGHTWVSPYNQAPAVVKEVFERADKLPLTLRVVTEPGRASRFLVTASTLPGVATGAELLAVDGHGAGAITQALMPYLRADGRSAGSDAKRLSQLNTGPNGGAMDRLFPLLFPPSAQGWRLALRDTPNSTTRELWAQPLSVAARTQALGAAAPATTAAPWTLAFDGDTAVLTLPTFAFWRGGFDARGFLQRSFAELKARQVTQLVIDIRANEGGDDGLGQALLSHLIKQPYTVPASRLESAYERAPYELARFLDTWDFSFFDRTGQVQRTAGRNWRLPDKAAATVQPVAEPFSGTTVLLVGPQNSSAGYLLARDMQRSGAATLLGQPTGGNLRGLNGGQLAWVNLPHSGAGVDIPLVAAFTPGEEPDRGVIPDLEVAPRWDDAVAGIDTELAAARRWLASRRAAAR